MKMAENWSFFFFILNDVRLGDRVVEMTKGWGKFGVRIERVEAYHLSSYQPFIIVITIAIVLVLNVS